MFSIDLYWGCAKGTCLFSLSLSSPHFFLSLLPPPSFPLCFFVSLCVSARLCVCLSQGTLGWQKPGSKPGEGGRVNAGYVECVLYKLCCLENVFSVFYKAPWVRHGMGVGGGRLLGRVHIFSLPHKGGHPPHTHTVVECS